MRYERSNQSVELTATRCAFTFDMTRTSSLEPRSLSMAVAHFFLVRPMRTTLVIAAFFIASRVVAGEFDGAWVLSGKWTGYMGLALKIRGDHYKYWFSSDMAEPTFSSEITMPDGHVERHTYIPKRPKYPFTGRAVLHGDTLELRGPGDYYDRKWRRIVYRGVPCLLAEEHYREWKKSGRLPDDRLLFRIPRFDDEHPQLNYGGHERADGSVSATSPFAHK